LKCSKNRYGLEDKVPCVVASLAPLFTRAATPMTKWTPEARRLLRQELTWFKNLYDDLAS
jgi:hypothetical protein